VFVGRKGGVAPALSGVGGRPALPPPVYQELAYLGHPRRVQSAGEGGGVKNSNGSFARVRGLAVAVGLVLGMAFGTSGLAEGPQAGAAGAHMNIKLPGRKGERIFPEAGERSAEIAILHVDPKTQATELMIRVPRNSHVPTHWHTANETHTVVSGTFIIECEGKREALGPGSFNYVPSRMHHEAWT